MSQPDVYPNSIMFSENAVEISFIEARDQTPKAGMVKTLILDKSLFGTMITELEDLVVDLIDAGLIEIRQPPQELPVRRRREARSEVEEVDEG